MTSEINKEEEFMDPKVKLIATVVAALLVVGGVLLGVDLKGLVCGN